MATCISVRLTSRARAFALAKGFVVEQRQQFCHLFVHFAEAEEGALAQSGDDPSLHYLNGVFNFGFGLSRQLHLIEAIRKVHSGKKSVPPEVASHLAEHLTGESLTEREIEVLRHIAGGNRNKDIAERLFISEETVKVHVKHIMEKLGASDRTQAMTIAVRRGIIQI